MGALLSNGSQQEREREREVGGWKAKGRGRGFRMDGAPLYGCYWINNGELKQAASLDCKPDCQSDRIGSSTHRRSFSIEIKWESKWERRKQNLPLGEANHDARWGKSVVLLTTTLAHYYRAKWLNEAVRWISHLARGTAQMFSAFVHETQIGWALFWAQSIDQ